MDKEKYYLHGNNEFYNTAQYAISWNFNTQENMELYIEKHLDSIKQEYGNNIKVQAFKQNKHLGWCKKLKE